MPFKPMTRSWLIPIFIIALSTSTRAGDDLGKSLAEASLKLGGSGVKSLVRSLDTDFPRPAGPPIAQREALEATLRQYQADRAIKEGSLQFQRAAVDFALDASVIVAQATGAAAVPTLIVKGTVQIATDMYFDGAQRQLSQELEGYLASKKSQLIDIGGVSYSQLQTKSPTEIKAALEQSTTVFADLETMFPSDPAGKQMAKDLLVDGIKNTVMAVLDKVEKNTARLDGVDARLSNLTKSFARFSAGTVAALDAHEQALKSLNITVQEMQSSVTSLDKRLKAQERDQGVIADFVFDRMPASTKVQSLEAGFMKERFACADGSNQCEGAKLKADMLVRFKAEEKLQIAIVGFEQTVGGLANVATIASNFGISIPGIDEAVNVGGVAVKAFSAFASGNYLGAAAAVSGLFGKRVDPQQARFDALRSYLDQQFQQMNAKIDAVLVNQQKLMDAIVMLSDQMTRQTDALEEHLAIIDFELKRVSDTARISAWSAWASCYSVFKHVTVDNSASVDYDGSDFQSMRGVYAAAQSRGRQAKSCMEQTLNASDGMTAQQIFGSFFDVRNAIEFYPAELADSESASGKYHQKSDLQLFLNSVHAPTVDVISGYLKQKQLPWSYAFQLLAGPTPSVLEIKERLTIDRAKREPCGGSGYLVRRLQDIICPSPDGPEQAAHRIMTTALLADTALTISDWILVNARIADILDQTKDDFIPPNQILEYAKNNALSGAGVQMTRGALMILDAATTTYSLLYGDLTARAIVDVLNSKHDSDPGVESSRRARIESVRSLLANNGYLAANVAMLLLHERWKLKDEAGNQLLPSRHPYRWALESALSSQHNPTFALEGLFEGLEFAVDQKKQMVFVTLVGEGPKKVQAPLLGVETFVAGQLIFPPRMMRLLSQRERVLDRILDYRMTSALSEDQRQTVSLLIARGAKNTRK